ncbi:superoxide dismutase family protein [Sphingomonas montana]|uniref:superoxide dismutase family protein n=1 Tax=Sphingomonas montana TaxID=1843236 RepID=UPI0013EBE144|nr:superoxide dismutase family protein [Sphingomonas montana]
MNRLVLGVATTCIVALSGCAMDGGTGRPQGDMAAAGASVMLLDASGAQKGTASLRQTAAGLQMTVTAMGMTLGPKGLHFHMTGRCDAPDFTTAGGHWNPTAMKHGKDSGVGPHGGDLPNIEISADGTGRAETTLAGAMLTGGATPLMDADGAALIIHAAADDYRTDPSGNSGARLACGVVTPT